MKTSLAPPIILAIALIAVATFGAFAIESVKREIENLGQRLSLIDRRTTTILEELRLTSPRDLGNRRLDVRTFVIRNQLSQAVHPIVFVGDSITESARLPSSICGRPVVNAGIGGAAVLSYADIASDVLAELDASLIVLALGLNDAAAGSDLPADFRDSFRALVGTARQHAHKTILVGVPPIGDGPMENHFDLEKAKQIDDIIRDVARDEEIEFVDIRAMFKSDPVTIDGIHLWAEGYKPWLGAIIDGIGRALACNQVNAP